MRSRESCPFPLAMADPNATVRIVARRGGHGLNRRLTDMGLNVGCEIQVVGRRGAGFVLARGQARLMLGGGVAQRILVVPA